MSGIGATESAITDWLMGALSSHLRNVPADVQWDTARLPDLGLDSMSAIELVLAVEEHFEVQFPDELLVRETFGHLSTLTAAIRSMLGETS